jgi:solute carrier family 25 carnitine/acylcarnitine transporter 20/29
MKPLDFIAGWVGGIAVLGVCHPLDTVRVQSQMSNNLNTLQVTRQIWGGLGVKGFYRGITSPMVGFGLANAMRFGVYGNLIQELSRQQQRLHAAAREAERRKKCEELEREIEGAAWHVGLFMRVQRALGQGPEAVDDAFDPDDMSSAMRNGGQLPLHLNMLSAVAGGVTFSTVMTPFEMVKVRLQTESMFHHRTYYNALHCARKLYRQGGVRKLYTGYSATLARDIPFAVLYFGSYGTMRRIIPGTCPTSELGSTLASGAVAGAATWAVVIPIDTIKTRIQAAKEGTYLDINHAVRELHARSGIRGFYNGIAPAMLRASVQSAVCFGAVELTLKALK